MNVHLDAVDKMSLKKIAEHVIKCDECFSRLVEIFKQALFKELEP